MTPSLTIAIATFNRADIWRRGLMVEALKNQTDQDFELLICDDGSTDGTLNVLKEIQWPRFTRLFHCSRHKCATQADAWPKNILINEATAPVFLSLDDDGWVRTDTVAKFKSLGIEKTSGAYYGEIRMVDPSTLATFWIDSRTNYIGDNTRKVIPDDIHWEHGCIWATATDVLRYIGGHDMKQSHLRGSDRRLGYRLKQAVRTHYISETGCQFFHLGKSWTQENQDAEARSQVYAKPDYDNPPQVIANGGESFWWDFPIQYHEELIHHL